MLSSRIEFPPDDVSILIDVLIVIAISDPVIGWSIGYPDVQYLIGRRSLLVLLEYWVLWCQRVYKALALIWLVRWANICKCKNRESFISKVLVVWLMENFVIVFDILGYGLFIWFRIYYQRLGAQRAQSNFAALLFQISSNSECYLDKDGSSPSLSLILKIFTEING